MHNDVELISLFAQSQEISSLCLTQSRCLESLF